MASSREWFESVAEAQRRAQKRLPRSVYGRSSPAPSAAAPSTTTSPPSASSASLPRVATGVAGPRAAWRPR